MPDLLTIYKSVRFPENEMDRWHIDVLKMRTRGDAVKHIAGTTSRNFSIDGEMECNINIINAKVSLNV